MASFISKLRAECEKSKLDKSDVKPVRFATDLSVPHHILGPLFREPVPASVIGLCKDHCLAPLLSGIDWSKWDSAKPQGSWPSTPPTWTSWVERMSNFFDVKWKAQGIYDAIWLSTVEIAMDKELLMAALSFWCSATNTMVLPFGPAGPTVLDISAILGTPPSGASVDATLAAHSGRLDMKVLFEMRAADSLKAEDKEASKEEVHKRFKNFFNYNTLCFHFAGHGQDAIRKGEHEAFLFYWYNKFICCPRSNKCLVENMPVAEALASGRVLALSPAILANLFRCLAETTAAEIDPQQSGPLWLFQLWLQVYFATLRPDLPSFLPTEILGAQLVSLPVPPHRAEEIFTFFFGLDTLSDDEFLICRRRTYPESIRLPTTAWDAETDLVLRPHWGSFMLSRDLPLGCEARRASWEVYHPNFTARQLGYVQGAPVPLLSSRTRLDRGRLSGFLEKEFKSAERDFEERCTKFCLKPVEPEVICSDTFGDWWEAYTRDFFGKPVAGIVTKLFGDRPKKSALAVKSVTQGMFQTFFLQYSSI